MDKRQYKGYWWLPSEQKDQVAGTLTIDSRGNLKLELFGGFGLDEEEISFERKEDPVIFGRCYAPNSYRSKSEHSELLSFNNVTKESAERCCICREALLEGKKDCEFPTLRKIETDGAISYMNPLVEAFQEKNKNRA